MKSTGLLLLLAIIFAPSLAVAEGGCPPGQIPYSGTSLSSCGPIQGGKSTSRPQWESRWGAVATDDKGKFGIATDQKSERLARKQAVDECRRRGGAPCTAEFTFRNQCAAVATSAKVSYSQGAASEEEAKELSMRKCLASDSGECWIYYSGCSLPIPAR
ncbi:DUF4189 domain-containing protein [Lysobacter sp. ISL-42]|nr:DUF4189 domain-containing protein [Lysobacter sp. ISL-42]MBT2751535.1 DUF4189 domain-containing protein [Lysobacter sp. ISL-50]MBT2775729.1 DUF4189 domain-containing protein [Lysobacter sp. ISL-54]MBT2782306.1 DUF4189 domain-containing protein [Lysobacter sp. ISL-52]